MIHCPTCSSLGYVDQRIENDRIVSHGQLCPTCGGTGDLERGASDDNAWYCTPPDEDQARRLLQLSSCEGVCGADGICPLCNREHSRSLPPPSTFT